MSSHGTVILDVDGTLADSSFHHPLAWARAFDRVGLRPPTWRIQRAIGLGGDKLVAAVADWDLLLTSAPPAGAADTDSPLPEV